MPKDIVNYQKICKELLLGLPKRTSEVISRRFGLRSGQEETLEAIGKDFSITRERVRQIERDGLNRIRPRVLKYKAIFSSFQKTLKESGNFKKENSLLLELGGEKFKTCASFLLSLRNDFQRIPETEELHTLWAQSSEAVESAKGIIKSFSQKLAESKKPLSFQELSASLPNKTSAKVLLACLEASKQIKKTHAGLYGLKDWPEVSPRGVKDRAYLVFKEKNQPLHFTEVARLIDGFALSSRKTVPQTVHNELIKDSRFVLVGRGTYALKEWGYAPGVVKDVIAKIMADSGKPLAKEDILEKVLKQRMVKANTILLNLNDKKYFSKTQEGLYTLNKIQEA